eukprot:3729781-Rhodomonas_salina.2
MRLTHNVALLTRGCGSRRWLVAPQNNREVDPHSLSVRTCTLCPHLHSLSALSLSVCTCTLCLHRVRTITLEPRAFVAAHAHTSLALTWRVVR